MHLSSKGCSEPRPQGLASCSAPSAPTPHTVQLPGQDGNPGQEPVPLGTPTWRGTEPCGKAEDSAQKPEQAQAPSRPSLTDLTGHYFLGLWYCLYLDTLSNTSRPPFPQTTRPTAV